MSCGLASTRSALSNNPERTLVEIDIVAHGEGQLTEDGAERGVVDDTSALVAWTFLTFQ